MKEIDENNVKNIKYENIIAISISELGAMGEKCGVHIVLENLEVYHTNYAESKYMTIEKLQQMIPILAEGYRLENNWNFMYMGMGHNLIIRNDYYDDFIGKEKDRNPIEIHKRWLEMLSRYEGIKRC